MPDINPIKCAVENASKFLLWCRDRGGVARWHSVDLSDPWASWSTPALTLQGTPTPQPTWKSAKTPELIESDPAKIIVFTDSEVTRFHVAVRRGSQGLSFKLTDASSKKVRAAVAEAGNGAYYCFDFDTQEAVIRRPTKMQTLAEWAAAQGGAA